MKTTHRYAELKTTDIYQALGKDARLLCGTIENHTRDIEKDIMKLHVAGLSTAAITDRLYAGAKTRMRNTYIDGIGPKTEPTTSEAFLAFGRFVEKVIREKQRPKRRKNGNAGHSAGR